MAPKKKPTPAEEAVARFKKSQAALKRLPNSVQLKKLEKDCQATINQCKRDQEQLRELESSKKIKKSRTRSGKRRGPAPREDEASNGKWINKGMDDADGKFDEDEQKYLRNAISKMKSLHDLKFEHLQYLIIYEFLDDLTKVKEGKVQSQFHDRYMALGDRCKNELLTEIRTSLFTNDQRDYLQGLLQGVFKTNQKDEKGDIPYDQIEYVEIVMIAESIVRIVKYFYNLDTFEETNAFMKKKSREVYGISDDEGDDWYLRCT